MPSFNKVILIGNVTKDIELRQTPNGKEVARFSIAVNKKYAKGAQQGQADFFNISAWGATATFVSQWFKRGDPILIEGSIHNNHYKDKDGVDRFTVDITADSVSFVSIKGEQSLRNVDEAFDAAAGYSGAGAETMPQLAPLDVNDDLPF